MEQFLVLNVLLNYNCLFKGAVTEEVKEEQTEFTIKLTGFDDGGKVKLIKEVKTLMEGMNLVQVKLFQ